MKKRIIAVAMIAMLTVFMMFSFACDASANVQWFDTTYNFNYAYINLGNGTVVEGKVKSWKDWEDSDMIQVKMYDDTTYYTHGSNVVLVAR